VCSEEEVNNINSADGKAKKGSRCTSASEGRLSRWRLRVRDAKRKGVWICGWDWNESIAMKELDEIGDERRDEVVEISESERLRLRTEAMMNGGKREMVIVILKNWTREESEELRL
jgi:hypothetical protein